MKRYFIGTIIFLLLIIGNVSFAQEENPYAALGMALAKIDANNVSNARNAGLSELKLRILNDEDPIEIYKNLLQSILDEQPKQTTRSLIMWPTAIIGGGLMGSSIFFILDSENQNWPMFGIFLGSGAALAGVGIYFGFKYDKGRYRLASLKAQVSFIETYLRED